MQCSGKFQPKRTVFTEQTFGVGNKRCGPHVRRPRRNNPCQDASLYGKKFSTGAPNALCPHPKACTPNFLSTSQYSHNEALVINLERATKLFHISPALLQSSDGHCSRQERHNVYTGGELAGVIEWPVVFAGKVDRKHRKNNLKLAEYEEQISYRTREKLSPRRRAP